MYLQQAASSSRQRGGCNKGDNNKYNKRNISMNSSCPYIKLFLLSPRSFLSFSFSWNKRTCLSKRKKSCVVLWEEKCFSFIFLFFFFGCGRLPWLANCVWPRVRSGETEAGGARAVPHGAYEARKASYCVTDFYK